MTVMFTRSSRNKVKEEEPPKPLVPDKIIDIVKNVLRFGLYEDGDFEVTQEYIRVDLAYDTASTVDSYQDRLKAKFPGRVNIDDTITTIFFN